MRGGIYPTKYGYQVRFPVSGSRSGLTKHFKSLDLAERFLTGLRFKSDEGTFDPRDYQRDNPLSFSRLTEKFLESKRHCIGWKKYEQRLRFAVDAWGHRNIKTIGYGELEDLINSLRDAGKSPKYIKDIRDCLRMFFRWVCRREKHIELPEFPEVSGEMAFRKILTKEQQQAVLDEVYRISWEFNPRIYIGILFLSTYINIRPNELRNIKEKDIDLERGAILIPHPKERTPKYVSLLSDDVKLLKGIGKAFGELYFFRHISGNGAAKQLGQFGRDYLSRWWAKACHNLVIEAVSIYPGTRHTTAIALRETESPEAIKRGMGTKSNKAFERYLQVTAQEQRDLYAKTRSNTKLGNIIDLPKVRNSL